MSKKDLRIGYQPATSTLEKKSSLVKILEDIQDQMEQAEIIKEMLLKEKEVDRKILAIQRREVEELRIRSRFVWLKGGDQNTKFFNYQCKEWNGKNTINEITKENGENLIEPEEIKREIKEHFEDLYTNEEEVTQEEMASLSDEIPKLLRDNLEALVEPVSFAELCSVVWFLHPDKALGLMGSLLASIEVVGISSKKTC